MVYQQPCGSTRYTLYWYTGQRIDRYERFIRVMCLWYTNSPLVAPGKQYTGKKGKEGKTLKDKTGCCVHFEDVLSNLGGF